MSDALVFSIEEFSVFDGPGIRTSVFLSGCPLRCEWCHNPEGQSFTNRILRNEQGCVGCGNCFRYSTDNCGKPQFSEKSIKMCPKGLLRYNAVRYSASELVEKLSKNFDVLEGVTFSGGEPLCHSEFVIECFELMKGKTSRALQTSGYADGEVFCKTLEHTDYVLYDIKLVDPKEHLRYTGVDNQKILNNLKTLSKSGKQFVIRTPLIPTVTDTKSNITAICELLCQNGINKIELLPYNKFAGAKYHLVDKEYAPSFNGEDPCEFHTDIFKSYSIQATIMREASL